MIVLVLSSKSPFMDQLIKDHLGVFSSITSDMFNDYRTDKLSPFIEQSNEIHKYAIYLFYASIAFFIFQLYILKNKCFSKDFVLFSSIAFSIAILLLAYYYNYYSELSMSALVRTETLGLFGGSKEKAVGSAIDAVSYIGTFFFFLHYYQNIWLFQYYYEPDEVVSNNHEYSSNNYEYSNEVVKLDAQADDNKYQNLRDLKTLLDSGVLTQGEFDQQKKEILNS